MNFQVGDRVRVPRGTSVWHLKSRTNEKRRQSYPVTLTAVIPYDDGDDVAQWQGNRGEIFYCRTRDLEPLTFGNDVAAALNAVSREIEHTAESYTGQSRWCVRQCLGAVDRVRRRMLRRPRSPR